MTTRDVSHDAGPARPGEVIAFNLAPFLLGPAAGIVAIVSALAPLPLPLRVALVIGGTAALVLSLFAAVTTWWVFGHGADRRWAWIRDRAGSPRSWINLTTGFDDATGTLRASIPGAGIAMDVFDGTVHHEAALLRARRRFPPTVPSMAPDALDASLDAGSADVVFLLMAAHETHGQARLRLIRSAARVLAPGGRLVLVEHLRDAANILAFGPGAWHFSSRASWLATARAANLELVDETRLTPFVAGFVFVRWNDR